MVGQAHIDAAVLAEPVRGLIAGDVQGAEIDEDLQRVEVVACLDGHQLVLQDVEAVQPVDPRTQVAGQIDRVTEQPVTVLDHLPAPPVECGVDDRVGAGRHQQVGARRQVHRVDQVALRVQHGALLEPGAHLVDADHADLRAASIAQVGRSSWNGR